MSSFLNSGTTYDLSQTYLEERHRQVRQEKLAIIARSTMPEANPFQGLVTRLNEYRKWSNWRKSQRTEKVRA